VPLDYSHPDAGTIGIALNRKPATDKANRIGSVLTNPGGPGASGIQFLQGDASSMTNLNRRFDLIGFDPRGIGQSAPVVCLTGPQEDAFNAIDSVLDDPQEKQAFIQADKNFAAGCMERSAKVLPFVDTVSTARDMDLIRAALGDAKLTYLGFSYGTFLGQTYAHLFPTKVRALALDGVLDPSLSANDLLLAQLVGFERNLEAFLADCKARRSSATPCAYAASGDPATKLDALMTRLDSTPLPVGKRALTRGLAVTGVLLGLYSESFWPALDKALTAADSGNGVILLQLADFYLARNADGTYDNETDANWAVNCLDRPVSTDIATYDALGPTYAKASPLFGPSFQYSNMLRLLAGETHRSRRSADRGRRTTDPARRGHRRSRYTICVGPGGEPAAGGLRLADAPGQRPHLIRRERLRAHGNRRLPPQPDAAGPRDRLLQLVS
jgi:alpha/beta hydrolase fold.